MTPKYWEEKARALYPLRVRFVIATLAAVALFIAAGFLVRNPAARYVAPLAFGGVTICWSLVLLCFWFEPTKGSVRMDSWSGRHLGPLHVMMRWWAACMLVMFFTFGVAAPIWWLVTLKPCAC